MFFDFRFKFCHLHASSLLLLLCFSSLFFRFCFCSKNVEKKHNSTTDCEQWEKCLPTRAYTFAVQKQWAKKKKRLYETGCGVPFDQNDATFLQLPLIIIFILSFWNVRQLTMIKKSIVTRWRSSTKLNYIWIIVSGQRVWLSKQVKINSL